MFSDGMIQKVTIPQMRKLRKPNLLHLQQKIVLMTPNLIPTAAPLTLMKNPAQIPLLGLKPLKTEMLEQNFLKGRNPKRVLMIAMLKIALEDIQAPMIVKID